MTELLSSIFKDLIQVPERPTRITNLIGSSKALFLVQMAIKFRQHRHILITASEDEALSILKDVQFFSAVSGIPQLSLSLIPEADESASAGKRMVAIEKSLSATVVIGSEAAFTRPSWSPKQLSELSIELKVGSNMDRHELIERLQRTGYKRAGLVTDRGQFCERRWVFDIFPSNSDMPLRVEFFGEIIDSIKFFDVATQKSRESLQNFKIMPAFESSNGTAVYTQFDQDNTVFYFTIQPTNMEVSDRSFILDTIALEGHPRAPLLPLSGLGLLVRERADLSEMVKTLNTLVNRDHYRVVLVLNTDSQIERLREVFIENNTPVPFIPLQKVSSYKGNMCITKGNLSTGFRSPGLIILTSADLFGTRIPQKKKKQNLERLLQSLDEIKEGDYVVHKDYGIGRFLGMKMLKTSAGLTEAMIIEYRDSAKLYVPVYNIGLVQKYKAEEGAIPALDRLDGRAWQKKKQRIRKKIQEMAYRLLKLYARRELSRAHAFSPDGYLHKEFENFFPYEETPDQQRAWEEIRRDMEKEVPMDRLLCGDVGFGKTELAMRAAFKAVYDGKQVAVLVPTTLLCEQHYRNFLQRFSAFSIKVDFLSRFKTPSEIKQTLQRLRDGKIDIIIGTHLLLSPKVQFKDLGLLIVDEEHRFGVVQKERIKELKRNIHCLSLSATPIPRTLEMALSGIRQLSLIETPPEERLEVKGTVAIFSKDLIRDAIKKELSRGGQVFFVHNTVQDIDKWKRILQEIVPEATIAIAHGQMKEKQLEEVMLAFVQGKYQVLLCTSIIGSGIDIPNANTIIINNAHRMGLADLYQLKGRVGRSNKRAYAYFLIPPPGSLTETAKKRIAAIQELNYLGAGLQLALRDLEIRGAGNLLGKEQSGHIHAIGFDLYLQMLKEEIALLQGKEIEEEPEPLVELRTSAFIPDEYVPDISIRLNLYRRLYHTGSDQELEEILQEMVDRFGPLPEEVKNLAAVMKLRIVCRKLKILSIRATKDSIRITVDTKTPLTAEEILSLKEKWVLKLHPDGFSLKKEIPLDTLLHLLQSLHKNTGTVHVNFN